MTYEELLELTNAGVEVWKPVAGYDYNYQISNFGRVKKIIINASGKIIETFLKHCTTSYGYPYVGLIKDKKAKTTYIHRLIAIAFIPNPYNKPEIDHINTNTKDYRLENLRWVTHKENANNVLTSQHRKENTYSKEAVENNLMKRKINNGISAPKTVYQYTLDGIFVNCFFSMEEAERQTGASHICEVLDDNTLSAGGFLWTSKFVETLKYQKRISARLKPIIQYDLKGNFIAEWPSVSEAAKQLKMSTSNICRSIKCTSPRKYIFKYKGSV